MEKKQHADPLAVTNFMVGLLSLSLAIYVGGSSSMFDGLGFAVFGVTFICHAISIQTRRAKEAASKASSP